MNQKLYYITCGYLLLLGNYMLLGTRFNIVGLFFAVGAGICFIKSMRIKK